jgi:hypothetical protein
MMTKTATKTITYYYRGEIERGGHWAEGWSENSEDGLPLYPWSTKRECQHAAKLQGSKAVFVQDEKQRLA